MIDPRGLTLHQWCDAVTLDLSNLVTVPRLEHSEDWVRWAIGVSSSTSISPYHPPDPRYFSHWRQWAERFVQAVPL